MQSRFDESQGLHPFCIQKLLIARGAFNGIPNGFQKLFGCLGEDLKTLPNQAVPHFHSRQEWAETKVIIIF